MLMKIQQIKIFDTKIENIHSFNVNTQISINKEEKINIIPNTEAKKVLIIKFVFGLYS